MSYDNDSDPPLWFEVFQELMCRLYKALGGDCSDLDWSGAGDSSLQVVRTAFEEHGPPVFEMQEDSEDFLSTLEALEAHLGSPEATIPTQLRSGVRALIDEIRTAWVL